MVVAAMMVTMSMNAQIAGDFAIGANASYSIKDKNIAPGIKVQYSFTDWLRAEVAGDYWLKKDNREAFDAMLNLHGVIHAAWYLKYYPIAGIGFYSTKLSALDYMDPDYGVHVHFDGKTKSDLVGVAGIGVQVNFTDNFGLNVEGKYQFNVGNQFVGTAGLLFIF